MKHIGSTQKSTQTNRPVQTKVQANLDQAKVKIMSFASWGQLKSQKTLLRITNNWYIKFYVVKKKMMQSNHVCSCYQRKPQKHVSFWRTLKENFWYQYGPLVRKLEQSEEFKSPLYVVFVDFEKAFDSIDNINSRLRRIPKFRRTEKIRKKDWKKTNRHPL